MGLGFEETALFLRDTKYSQMKACKSGVYLTKPMARGEGRAGVGPGEETDWSDGNNH